MIIDGHLRRDTTPDGIVPVPVLNVTEEEATLKANRPIDAPRRLRHPKASNHLTTGVAHQIGTELAPGSKGTSDRHAAE